MSPPSVAIVPRVRFAAKALFTSAPNAKYYSYPVSVHSSGSVPEHYTNVSAAYMVVKP